MAVKDSIIGGLIGSGAVIGLGLAVTALRNKGRISGTGAAAVSGIRSDSGNSSGSGRRTSTFDNAADTARGNLEVCSRIIKRAAGRYAEQKRT